MNRLTTLGLLLCLLVVAGAGGDQPSGGNAPAAFPAEEFDWRDTLPYLEVAAGLPGEQGIKELLENLRVLRTYVADEVEAECRPGRCSAQDGLAAEVTKRIDRMVQEELFRQHKITRVDYPLTRQPFPFVEIAALRTDKRDAYLVLDFAEHACTAADVQQKYGAPYDVMVVQWYSLFRYKLETKDYSARAAFRIDPTTGEVTRVAVSLKRRRKSKQRERGE